MPSPGDLSKAPDIWRSNKGSLTGLLGDDKQVHIQPDGIIDLDESQHGFGWLDIKISHEHFLSGNESQLIFGASPGFHRNDDGAGNAGDGQGAVCLKRSPFPGGNLSAFRQMSPGEFELDTGVFVGAEGLIQILVHLGISAIEGFCFYVQLGIRKMGYFSTLSHIEAKGAFGKLIVAGAGKLIHVAGAIDGQAATGVDEVIGFGYIEGNSEKGKEGQHNF